MANSETNAETRFAELTTLLETHDAAELDSALGDRPGGVDGALDLIFETMAAGIDPAKLKGDRAGFEVTTSGGVRPYVIEAAGGACAARRGSDGTQQVTIGLSLADLLGMAAGRLNGQQAFLSGRLAVRGNPLLGMKLGKWLQQK